MKTGNTRITRSMMEADYISDFNSFAWMSRIHKAESVIATRLETAPKGTSMATYAAEKPRNTLYSTMKNNTRLVNSALGHLIDRPLWPATLLAKLMLHQGTVTPIYSSISELYDILTIVAYSAHINALFAPINDSWRAQMNFLAVCTGEIARFEAKDLVAMAQEKIMAMASQTRRCWPRLIFQWDAGSDNAYIQVVLASSPPATGTRDKVKFHCAQWLVNNQWNCGTNKNSTYRESETLSAQENINMMRQQFEAKQQVRNHILFVHKRTNIKILEKQRLQWI